MAATSPPGPEQGHPARGLDPVPHTTLYSNTLTFAGAELGFMVWLYNLRITYPLLEIYIADDDISGAFRLM
jgi:hypothetical protein